MSSNCSVFETLRYDIALGVRSGLSFISCALTLFTVFVIILFKKYHVFTQRLILYLALSCMFYLLSAGFNLNGNEAYTNRKSALGYCIFIGFAEQVTIWWIVMATFCIVLALFIHAICGKTTNRFELGYLFIIFVLPFTFCWVPLYYKAYGPDDMFCWIKEVNQFDCTDFITGQWLRYSLYYVPLSILMLVLVVLYVPVLIIVHKKKNQWAGMFNPEAIAVKKMIATEIRPLIYYPLIILIINAFPLVKQLYATASGQQRNMTYYYISLVSYIIYPFQGALLTLTFTLDPETRRLLTWKNILAAFMTCMRSKYGAIKDYPIETISSDSWSSATARYGAIVMNEETPNRTVHDGGK